MNYSNVFTIPAEEKENFSDDDVKKYFETITEYFKDQFGQENVLSAKVHLDETTPHMHLHFVPASEDGKLQAHKVMTRARMNKIHDELPRLLREKGFDVQRESSENKKYVKGVHEYKKKKRRN